MEVTQRFEIRRTPEVLALVEKYSHYGEDFMLGEELEQILSVLPSLSEWERVVLFAYSETKSIRRFAKFFSISEWKARHTIDEVKFKVKCLYKKL